MLERLLALQVELSREALTEDRRARINLIEVKFHSGTKKRKPHERYSNRVVKLGASLTRIRSTSGRNRVWGVLLEQWLAMLEQWQAASKIIN